MSIVPREVEKSVSKKQAKAKAKPKLKLSSKMTMEHRMKHMGQEYRRAYEKNEETISGLFDQIRSLVDDMKAEHENGQFFVEALQRLSLGEVSEPCSFVIIQSTKEEEEKERLFEQYEQTRQKEKSTISELADKIAQLEESLKKKKMDDGEFNSLVYTLMDYLR